MNRDIVHLQYRLISIQRGWAYKNKKREATIAFGHFWRIHLRPSLRQTIPIAYKIGINQWKYSIGVVSTRVFRPGMYKARIKNYNSQIERRIELVLFGLKDGSMMEMMMTMRSFSSSWMVVVECEFNQFWQQSLRWVDCECHRGESRGGKRPIIRLLHLVQPLQHRLWLQGCASRKQLHRCGVTWMLLRLQFWGFAF